MKNVRMCDELDKTCSGYADASVLRKSAKADRLKEERGSMRDIYIAQVPYHLLLSCNRGKKGDVLICIGQDWISSSLRGIVSKSFCIEDFYTIPPLTFYKDNLFRLLFFRLYMRAGSKALKEGSYETIYVFNDTDPIVQYLMNCLNAKTVSLIEEGIGLYWDTVKRRELFFQYLGKLFFGMNFENIRRIGESSPVRSIFCRYPEKLNALQRGKRIIPMEAIAFKQLAERMNIERTYAENWFIGQPLVEDGVLAEDEYLSLISKAITTIGNENENWLIKPHPRETKDKYQRLLAPNVSILSDSRTPIELLIDSWKRTNVFTVYSSAVLSLATICNIKCFALCLLTGKALLNEETIEIFRSGNVEIPRTWQEARKCGGTHAKNQDSSRILY